MYVVRWVMGTITFMTPSSGCVGARPGLGWVMYVGWVGWADVCWLGWLG
jgi:hypothetical protein